MAATNSFPDVVPILGRGRHRNMRKGACFMEMASYLAGEKWSDHPRCTHPLLGVLAREVNDLVDDDSRQQLVEMIPDVVHLHPKDRVVEARVARLCALTALRASPFESQRVAAVGLLASERALATFEGRDPQELSAEAATALAELPAAEAWARRFTGKVSGERQGRGSFAHRAAPAIIRSSVRGIRDAGFANPDAVLVKLLREAIDLCRSLTPPSAERALPQSPDPLRGHSRSPQTR
jgi:hypothetical protein